MVLQQQLPVWEERGRVGLLTLCLLCTAHLRTEQGDHGPAS